MPDSDRNRDLYDIVGFLHWVINNLTMNKICHHLCTQILLWLLTGCAVLALSSDYTPAGF